MMDDNTLDDRVYNDLYEGTHVPSLYRPSEPTEYVVPDEIWEDPGYSNPL